MKTHALFYRLLSLVLLVTLTACQATPTPGDAVALAQAQSWIDSPLSGSQLQFVLLDVVSHHYSPAGVTQVELSVDGVVLVTDPSPDPASNFVNITQQWQPPGPGQYTLSVRAQSGDGTWGSPAQSTVNIGDFSTATFTPTQVPTDTPTPEFTPTASLTPTEPPTATFTASATALRPTFTFTPSITPTLASFIDFTADSTSINAGQCTTLHWNSGGIQSIFLNNQPVTGKEDRQVCPTSTTTYNLVANYSGGQLSKQITITVSGQSSTLPNIGSYTTSTSSFDITSDCGNPGEITINVSVSNATSVTVNYRVVGDSFRQQAMNVIPGSNIWTKTLRGSNEVPDDPTGPFEFFFTASNAGGQSQSGTFGGVQYHNCKP